MTIIVFDGFTMAGDTAEYAYNHVVAHRDKVHRVDNGRLTFLWGISGNSTDIYRANIILHELFSESTLMTDLSDVSLKTEENQWAKLFGSADIMSGVVGVRDNETLEVATFNISNAPVLLPLDTNQYAVGMENCVVAALAAMRAGVSAITATEIACDLTNIDRREHITAKSF